MCKALGPEQPPLITLSYRVRVTLAQKAADAGLQRRSCCTREETWKFSDGEWAWATLADDLELSSAVTSSLQWKASNDGGGGLQCCG